MGIVPTIMFFFFLLGGFGIVYPLAAWMLSIFFCFVIFTLLTRHPLMSMIKGQGLLGMTFDSTGVIEPFLIKVMPPFIKGRINSMKKDATSLFDREAVFYMKPPKQAELVYTGDFLEKDDKGREENFTHYDLRVPKGKETDITFAFQQYMTFIYNKNMGAFLTKSALSKIETEGVIKHLVLYLKVKTEELTLIMRDFARYVIEMTKPKTSFLAGKGGMLIWIIFGIGILVLVLMFAPAIMNIVGPALSAGKSTVSSGIAQIAGTVKGVGG